MLAERRETPFDSADHIFELKWDGTRAICFLRDRQRFLNRRMSFIETRYPDIRVRTRKPAILDGEIVVMWEGRPSFAKLQERERPGGSIRLDYLLKTLPATYVAFDVLYIGDENLMSRPQMERKALLREVLEEDERVVLSDYVEARGVDYYNAVIARGLEGIIAKRKDARYQPGKRTKDWYKIKKKTTLDCVIAGITAGEGEREDTFGSLILGAYHEGVLVHVGRVGTGFSEVLRRSLFERLVRLRQEECPFPEVPEIDAHVGFWTKPEIVAEAHFLEFSKDRHMRAPTFSRLREDKRPEDCVVTFP
jgi:bifunctional non-homologous end joining protein LigD